MDVFSSAPFGDDTASLPPDLTAADVESEHPMH